MKDKQILELVFRFARFYILPTILGLIFGLTWVIFPREFLGIDIGDVSGLQNQFNFIGISHAIFAAAILGSVWLRNDKLKYSIRHNKKELFDEYADSRIHTVIHLLLITFSMALIYISLTIPSVSTFAGAQGSFLTAFIVTIWWKVAQELDDWKTGIWKLNPPKKWLKEEESLPEAETESSVLV